MQGGERPQSFWPSHPRKSERNQEKHSVGRVQNLRWSDVLDRRRHVLARIRSGSPGAYANGDLRGYGIGSEP